MASIEEQVEDIAKKQLDGIHVKYFTKTEEINSEIDNALKKSPSKSGGIGNNYPDIKLFLQTKTGRKIPVMIEVKGTKGALIKQNEDGDIENYKKDGSVNYANIQKYAVNGAIHYAKAILDYTESYAEVIAIGINGYKEATQTIQTEFGVYYISKNNFLYPKEVAKYTDLTFLAGNNLDNLVEKIDNLGLSAEEQEKKTKEFENQIEIKLKALNQKMHDDLKISVGSRVQLVAGLIMAALGVPDKVSPLELTDLRGNIGRNSNDGKIVVDKIADFLSEKKIPDEKKDLIVSDLSKVFIYSDLYKPINGESKIKTIYTVIKNDIMPIFTSAKHLDFTGRLFNVLNEWVDIPDGERNDVVLTPRYVCELMAKLCKVNQDSYVWDYAAGSAGFLISAMKQMIKDAEDNIKSPKELQEKVACIKYHQLLGIEKRADIYMLAVLNMILMGDGSTNILHKDSLTEFDGNYEQGEDLGKPFPATVFLLNPPYSAAGKGFIFVKKALSKMSSGRAAILIQENAGSGNGLPYTKEILENNTLVASIHMSDIFCGKAGVQTAIYVFDVGIKHNKDNIVKFIDFSNDGYSRQNRKKSSANVNLKNTDHALERYEEVVDIVLNRKRKTHYLDDCVIEDTINLEGKDWTYKQHQKIDTIPTEDDFRKTVVDYLSWKISDLMKGKQNFLSLQLKALKDEFKKNGGEFKEYKLGSNDLFQIEGTKSLDEGKLIFTSEGINFVGRVNENNGIKGKILQQNFEPNQSNTITATVIGNYKYVKFQEESYYCSQNINKLTPYFKINKDIALYLISHIQKFVSKYDGQQGGYKLEELTEHKILLPVKNEKIDFEYMEKFINILEEERMQIIETYLQKNGFGNY